jgi:thiosulfate reductase cytochrome b subunit
MQMVYAPAVESVDWTSFSEDGEPRLSYRGVRNGSLATGEVVAGFNPLLLPYRRPDGETRISRFNPVTSWYWVAGSPGRRVSISQLLDSDSTVHAELRQTPNEGVDVVRERLIESGLVDPRIVAEVTLHRITHGTAIGEWSTRECRSCHGADSELNRSFVLSSAVPEVMRPVGLVGEATELAGAIYVDDDGRFVYDPDISAVGTYVLGMHRVRWVDALGMLAVFGVLAAVLVHGGLHWYAHWKKPAIEQQSGQRVYMYSIYERFWHWLQALTVLTLLLTGVEVHFSMVQLFGFEKAVRLHSIVGFVVVVNAIAAALFHFASGEIRRFVPASAGFIEQATAQARYYTYGIFHHESHPFSKRPHQRLNPLQQITYLVILNVLLPLQVVTGILIWGVQRWPGVDSAFSGLSMIAPVHTFGAWMFAAFLLLHVYLTTTGATPTSSLRAMLVGWQDVRSQHDDLR